MELSELVASLLKPFEDGFQVSDLWDILTDIMEHTEEWEGLLSGGDKKQFALDALEEVLSHPLVDLPGPDWITKKVILWFAPSLIDKFVAMTKNGFKFG